MKTLYLLPLLTMAQDVVQRGDAPMRIAREVGISFETLKAHYPGLCDGNVCQGFFPEHVLNVSERRLQPVEAPRQQPARPVPSVGVAQLRGANGEIGTNVGSPGDNPRIIAYSRSLGLSGGDEVPWCVALVRWCLSRVGAPSANTGLAAAWGGFGPVVQLVYGAITVLKATEPRHSGNLGFLHAMEQSRVWLLSGNSGDRVGISAYRRVLLIAGNPYRWSY
jgi:uncharacterized protein (TIGR02594 family)